jgi:hypothetical protein
MIGGERHKCHREHFLDPRKIAEYQIEPFSVSMSKLACYKQ